MDRTARIKELRAEGMDMHGALALANKEQELEQRERQVVALERIATALESLEKNGLTTWIPGTV
jgi:hypothetical protein